MNKAGKQDGVLRIDLGKRQEILEAKKKKATFSVSPFSRIDSLDRLHVLSLPAFGALGHVELHGLALLQALEAACLDRREMHKNIFATLAADKAVALSVIEPLYCSLFCHVDTSFLFN
jgi:hypothetical protein